MFICWWVCDGNNVVQRKDDLGGRGGNWQRDVFEQVRRDEIWS